MLGCEKAAAQAAFVPSITRDLAALMAARGRIRESELTSWLEVSEYLVCFAASNKMTSLSTYVQRNIVPDLIQSTCDDGSAADDVSQGSNGRGDYAGPSTPIHPEDAFAEEDMLWMEGLRRTMPSEVSLDSSSSRPYTPAVSYDPSEEGSRGYKQDYAAARVQTMASRSALRGLFMGFKDKRVETAYVYRWVKAESRIQRIKRVRFSRILTGASACNHHVSNPPRIC